MASFGVTDVAMESTGVYWCPVYAVLESDFRLLLANARHVKQVEMARGRLRGKRMELAEVVPGLMRDHHRFVLRRHLDLIDEQSRQIEKLDMRIAAVTDVPFGAPLDLLQSIPGVGRRAAESMLAETGDDVSKFPTAGHFASWARVCPGNHESAGKRKPTSVG